MSAITTASSRSVRWLEDDPVTGNSWLRITTSTKAGTVVQDYEVERVQGKGDKWRLWRLDPQTYIMVCRNVDLYRKVCDCEDAVYRGQGKCKHILGLQAAFNSLPF